MRRARPQIRGVDQVEAFVKSDVTGDAAKTVLDRRSVPMRGPHRSERGMRAANSRHRRALLVNLDMQEYLQGTSRRIALYHAAFEIHFEEVCLALDRKRRPGRRNQDRIFKARADVSEGVDVVEAAERARRRRDIAP